MAKRDATNVCIWVTFKIICTKTYKFLCQTQALNIWASEVPVGKKGMKWNSGPQYYCYVDVVLYIFFFVPHRILGIFPQGFYFRLQTISLMLLYEMGRDWNEKENI